MAIGAAYAVHTYGRAPFSYLASSSAAVNPSARPLIRRVAIFDFDVHHGELTNSHPPPHHF